MKEENYSTSNKYLWVDARIRWGVRLFSMPIAWTFFLQYVPVVVCVCSSSRSFPNANISSMICMRHSSWSNRQWRLQLLSFLHSSSPFEQWYCSWRCQWKISNNVRLCTPIAKIVDESHVANWRIFSFDNKDMLPLRSNKLDYTSRNEEGIFVRCSAYHSPLKSKKGPRLICGLIYLFYTINCFWVRTFVRHRDGWHILDSLSTNLTIVHTYKSADILHTVHTLKWKGREKYNDWQKVWHEWQNCDASRRVKSSHILWGDKVKISLWVGSRNSILL